MKSVLKTAAVVAAIAGAALGVSGPARAGVSIGINIGVPIPVPGAVAYDYDSGGYCDRWGCPDEYWDMPVYYGPVFYDGSWFQGPTYYRDYGGARWFWVHGGWRRDEWRGPRPKWWRGDYRFGPALGYGFYLGHGFRHDRDHFWRGNDWRPGHAWDRNWRDHRGNERMHPDNMRIEEHDRDGHRDNDHRDNDHHDNDHHDNDHHGDHNGGGMMGGGGAMGGGGSMMMGGGNGNHHDDHKGGNGHGDSNDKDNGHGNSSDGDKPKHKDHGNGDGNGGNGH